MKLLILTTSCDRFGRNFLLGVQRQLCLYHGMLGACLGLQHSRDVVNLLLMTDHLTVCLAESFLQNVKNLT